MYKPAWGGILPAFPTPTTVDGSVDEASLRHLVRFLIANKAAGLVPVGGTGEYTALSPGDRLKAVAITVDEAAGEVPVMAGVLSPGYAEAMATGKEFKAAGADALLLIAPFYVRPTQPAIRSYFGRYRESLDIPLFFYDIPGKTSVVTHSQTIVDMAADGSIIGMKACSNDMHHFNQIATSVGEDFIALSGEDTLYPLHALMGAKGAILATATMMPAYWVRIHGLLQAGEYKEAMKAQQVLVSFLDAVFNETNPGPLKYALNWLGLPAGDALSPLSPPNSETISRLVAALRDLSERNVIASPGSEFGALSA